MEMSYETADLSIQRTLCHLICLKQIQEEVEAPGLGLRNWIANYLYDSAVWHEISSLPQVVVDAKGLDLEEKNRIAR